MIQYKDRHTTVFESALFRTTSAVIRTDDLVLVVDPTWLPGEIRRIRHYVEDIRGPRPVYLLFTHSDYDHIIAFGAFPEATVIASQALAASPDKDKQLAAIRKFDQEYYVRRDYPLTYPEVDIAIGADDEFLTVGDTRLSFWPAPGHNADGIFTLVEPLGIWIAGDYLSNEEFPFIYHDSRDYLATLDRAERIITGRRPSLLVPGHGDCTSDTAEMRQRVKDSRQYIKQLQDAVVKEKKFPLPELWERYDFRLGQEGFHQANLELVKGEVSGNSSTQKK